MVSERIRENYEFFREQLRDADPEDVYRGIGRLVVVDVTLERGIDNPQLIFESLNSTGMDLEPVRPDPQLHPDATAGKGANAAL